MNDGTLDTERTPMITPSEVLEHVFCPRFTWFMNVQHIDQHEDTRFKVLKGREVHQRRATANRDYLRRKIGDDPRSPSRIRTVRGVGYVFVKDSVSLKDGAP